MRKIYFYFTIWILVHNIQCFKHSTHVYVSYLRNEINITTLLNNSDKCVGLENTKFLLDNLYQMYNDQMAENFVRLLNYTLPIDQNFVFSITRFNLARCLYISSDYLNVEKVKNYIDSYIENINSNTFFSVNNDFNNYYTFELMSIYDKYEGNYLFGSVKSWLNYKILLENDHYLNVRGFYTKETIIETFRRLEKLDEKNYGHLKLKYRYIPCDFDEFVIIMNSDKLDITTFKRIKECKYYIDVIESANNFSKKWGENVNIKIYMDMIISMLKNYYKYDVNFLIEKLLKNYDSQKHFLIKYIFNEILYDGIDINEDVLQLIIEKTDEAFKNNNDYLVYRMFIYYKMLKNYNSLNTTKQTNLIKSLNNYQKNLWKRSQNYKDNKNYFKHIILTNHQFEKLYYSLYYNYRILNLYNSTNNKDFKGVVSSLFGYFSSVEKTIRINLNCTENLYVKIRLYYNQFHYEKSIENYIIKIEKAVKWYFDFHEKFDFCSRNLTNYDLNVYFLHPVYYKEYVSEILLEKDFQDVNIDVEGLYESDEDSIEKIKVIGHNSIILCFNKTRSEHELNLYHEIAHFFDKRYLSKDFFYEKCLHEGFAQVFALKYYKSINEKFVNDTIITMNKNKNFQLKDYEKIFHKSFKNIRYITIEKDFTCDQYQKYNHKLYLFYAILKCENSNEFYFNLLNDKYNKYNTFVMYTQRENFTCFKKEQVIEDIIL